MEMENRTNNSNSQRLISEAIRKIALGRGLERVNMAPGGISGIGTARMIHGYVAKIHSDPSDKEFQEYAGTVDVGEYPDETASSEPIIHKGVLLAATQHNEGGFLIVPGLFSDVTIVMDAATRHAYIVNYSQADILGFQSNTEAYIGVTETEELRPDDENSPDYDELEATGNKTATVYTATTVITIAQSKNGKEAGVIIEPEKISQKVDKSEVNQTGGKVEQTVNGTSLVVVDGKVTIGEESATEPLVLGNQLAQLMLEFLTECSKITTTTLLGTMPALNIPNFASLTSKIQNFLSKTAYTK